MEHTNPSGSNIKVNIVGAGLAGLSAAIHLAMKGVPGRLISTYPSERAQSVLAAGGINGALNTMGEDDKTEYHYNDTMKAGCDIADPEAVRGLTENAPDVIRWLDSLGVPFQRKGDVIQQRNFGGQKKKRTAYSRSSTGKVLMTALIDEARKYEAEGLITRYSRHEFERILLSGGICTGLVIRDRITGEESRFDGPVLMACGGLNGLFPGETTGTTANTGDAAATLFSEGVLFSNLEMIQYHPTTLRIPDKRLLVSEAARGEGGRLFIMRGGEKWYFMEEKYPELGNLMPRDVVSREEYFVMHDPDCGGQVYLDCTGLSSEIWKRRLPDLRKEVIYYTKHDPVKEPIAIEPGIHYFMGGIDTDAAHRTNKKFLYAAGECCSLYHGANRLGGNSMLGAVYGGERAAQTIAEELADCAANEPFGETDGAVQAAGEGTADEERQNREHGNSGKPENRPGTPESASPEDPLQRMRPEKTAAMEEMPVNSLHDGDENSLRDRDRLLGSTLYRSLGVVRTGELISEGIASLEEMLGDARSPREKARITLGLAILKSAFFRKESRGAQYRSDAPERSEEYHGTVIAEYGPGENIDISLRKA